MPRNLLVFAFIGLALGVPSGFSASTVEERLAELEKKTSALAAENAQLKKELGYAGEGKAPVFVVPAGKVKKIALGGFIQANGEFGDEPDARWAGVDDRFLLRRARINLTATFTDDLMAKIEADFGANSLTATGVARNTLTDAYLNWSKYEFANVRLGQFKTPFGYEQLTADTKLMTVERSLANDRLTMSRQVGAAVMGEVADKKLGYSVGAFNGSGANNGQNDNENFLWAGRVYGSAYDGVIAGQKVKITTGVNGFSTNDVGNQRSGLGFDTQLTAGRAMLNAEWLQNRNTEASDAAGWSVLGAWRFNPQWRGIVRYETYDSDTAAVDTTTDTWTFGVDYLFKGDDIKLTLNYVIGDQPAPAEDGGRLLARVQVVF